MVKIKWLSSMADRGSHILEYGGIYETDEFSKPIDKESFGVWKKEGVFEVIGDDAPTEEPTEEKATPVKESSEVTMKELNAEGDITSLSKDADEFNCPEEGCYKHPEGDGYKSYWQFLKHMKDKHDELWVVEDDKIVKTED